MMKKIEKIKLIRESERFSQTLFAELLDIPIRTYQDYEQERRKISAELLMKISQHPQFQKYTMWLMCDLTAEELPAGQVCPELVNEVDKKQSA